ncbi:MAG TPA: DUF2141 domain-containing protein [Flavisolibacter sp.]|nr:DUF2141 domain-containing protein [Flavisolibacter sp.]
MERYLDVDIAGDAYFAAETHMKMEYLKKQRLVVALLMICGYAGAQSRVVADVSNFSNNKGLCRACIFNNADAFGGDGQPVQCVQVGVSGQKAKAVFENLPAGTYAVMVFHDANSNNKFDKNFLGIPKEGYGASKNKLPFAAAPAFSENKFEVKDKTGVNLSIKLRYL